MKKMSAAVVVGLILGLFAGASGAETAGMDEQFLRLIENWDRGRSQEDARISGLNEELQSSMVEMRNMIAEWEKDHEVVEKLGARRREIRKLVVEIEGVLPTPDQKDLAGVVLGQHQQLLVLNSVLLGLLEEGVLNGSVGREKAQEVIDLTSFVERNARLAVQEARQGMAAMAVPLK